LLGTAQLKNSVKDRKSEYLVTLRPEVLSDAEHAFGNLFQRIHHVTRLAREGLGAQAERLTVALDDLEGLLELLFDYVSPVDLEVRPLNCGRVAESLQAHIRTHASGEFSVGVCPAVDVMADPRALSRGFHLLGKARARELRGASRIAIEVTHDRSAGRAELLMSAQSGADTAVQGNGSAGRMAEENLAWEVAARLIELQGGELRQLSGGALTCSVALPLAE